MKNHAIRSPVVMGIAGAILGTVAARLIRGATAKQRKERIEWQPAAGGVNAEYESYSAATPGLTEHAADFNGDATDGAANLTDGVKERAGNLADGMKERVGNLADGVKERAVALKDRAAGVVDGVRERLPSTEQLSGSAQDAYRFATEEQPALGGVLAMGVGMALGFLLPVTEREEQVIRPLKERAAANLGHLDDKVRELADKLDDKLGGTSPQDERRDEPPQPNPFGASQSRPYPSA